MRCASLPKFDSLVLVVEDDMRGAVADAAGFPLETRNRRLVKRAAVSRAFENPNQLTAGKPLQIRKSQSEGPFHQTIDYKFPLRQLNFRNVSMAADEEVLDRRNLIHEAVDRHFQIERAG